MWCIRIVFQCVVFFVASIATVDATNASPHKFTEIQPDGTETPPLHILGGPRKHVVSDEKGYTVIREGSTDEIVYAKQDSNTGELKSTGLIVGRDDPEEVADLEPGETSSEEVAEKECGKFCTDPDEDPDNQYRVGSITLHWSLRRLRGSANNKGEEDGSLENWRHHPRILQKQKLATGVLRNLVILIRFADHKDRRLPTATHVNMLMNSYKGDPTYAPSGSVRDYFYKNSYTRLDIQSTIVSWIDLPHTEAYYADGTSGSSDRFEEALRSALDAVNEVPNFKFSQFDKDGDRVVDSVMFLHSGYGAEWGATDCFKQRKENRIWSHKWKIGSDPEPWVSKDGYRVANYHTSSAIWSTCGSNIARIGTLVHEIGHVLGLPDLYEGGSGIGSFGVMGNSWGFDGSQYYPPSVCAWSKIMMDWASPETVTESAQYTLKPSENAPQILKITHGFPSNEYLLVENRQPLEFDAKMPNGGLVIWHIDDEASFGRNTGYPDQADWPENGKHNRVALLSPDGRYDLERGLNRGDREDVWAHDSARNEIGSSSTSTLVFPNTDAYQGGIVKKTGIRIFDISSADPEDKSLVFNVELNDPNFPESLQSQQTPKPTAKATERVIRVPTTSPTVPPTRIPTPAPMKATSSFSANKEVKELETTVVGGNGGSGLMFDVVAGSNGLVVYTLDFHTRAEGPSNVWVYSKKGTHVGYETNSDEWALICSTTVQAMGTNVFTPIHHEDFSNVIIKPYATHAFYITMAASDLRYTNGRNVGNVQAANSDMSILEGTGVSGKYPESPNNPRQFFASRLFNGRIVYSAIPPEDIAAFVSSVEEEHHSLTTTMEDDNGSFGCMFDVEAKKDTVTVTGMEIHTRAIEGSYIPVQLFTKHGTHKGYEDKRSSWTEVGSSVILSKGVDNTTPLPISFFHESDVLTIEPGSVQAFFVLLKEPHLRYTNGIFTVDDGQIRVQSGSGFGAPTFGTSIDELPVYSPRTWNGILHYKTTNPSQIAKSAISAINPVQSNKKEIITTFDGQLYSYGFMFDLRAKKGIDLLTLGIHTHLENVATHVVVYTKPGTHVGYEHSLSEWNLVSNTFVQGQGFMRRTTIPESAFSRVHLESDTIQAFYVSLSSKSIWCSKPDDEVSFNDVYESNDELEIMVGTSIDAFPLPDSGQSHFKPRRVFNGVLTYTELS